MQYDFTTWVDRSHSGSEKWNDMRRICPDVPAGIVPLSVADMELKNPPPIIEGLKEYLDQVILGYTEATDDYYTAVQNWMEKHHGFRPPRDWFVESPGVVPAIQMMIGAFTAPSDSVLITTPVYYPFKSSIEANHRGVVTNELLIRDGRYEIDFEDLEEKAARPDVTLYILCSPHNPVGRVWNREDLLKICEICLRHHVFIISDEIHFDLIMPGFQHVSLGTFPDKYLQNCAICTAPSKTFNLAGFQTSNIFIPNPDYREKVTGARGYFALNVMGYKACELAYTRCEDWLSELLLHLDGNRKMVEDFLAAHLPMIHAFPLEGTYLQWLDFRALGMDHEALEDFMHHKAYWFCDEGYIFGEGGRGFERLNLACPRQVLEDALLRLEKAIQTR